MKEHKVEQGSDDWFMLHQGIPTASHFHRIITAKGCKLSKSCDRYIDEIIGNAMHAKDGRFPPRVEQWTNRAMDFGRQNEAEARFWFRMETGLDARQTGFCTTDDGRFGCSPDGLIDPDAGLELKCPYKPEIQLGYIREGGCPARHLAQVHGNLIVTGRSHWWFLSYCHGLPKHFVKVVPDTFTDELRVCLEIFDKKLKDAKEKIACLTGS